MMVTKKSIVKAIIEECMLMRKFFLVIILLISWLLKKKNHLWIESTNGSSSINSRMKELILKEIQQVPSMRLVIETNRESMQIHGFNQFEEFVIPYKKRNQYKEVIQYRGMAHFLEQDQYHEYYLMDDILYHYTFSSTNGNNRTNSTIECSDLSSRDNDLYYVPHFQQVFDAMSHATVLHTFLLNRISSIDSSKTRWFLRGCSFNSVHWTLFQGEEYVFCRSKEISKGFRINSQDLSIQVFYLEQSIDLQLPLPSFSSCLMTSEKKSTSNNSKQSRSSVHLSSTITPTRASTTIVPLSEMDLLLRQDTEEDIGGQESSLSSCSCKSTKRPCIFFHGLGKTLEDGQISENEMFGSIRQHAPCCSKFVFTHLNTKDYGWTNRTLQEKVCHMALQFSGNHTKKIENTILVTHSMGVNMLAGAIANGLCTIGENTEWISLGGPLRGSMGQDYLIDKCGNKTWMGKVSGMCPPGRADYDLVYDYPNGHVGHLATVTLKQQYHNARLVHRQFATAVMCGDSIFGIWGGAWQYQMTALGALVPHLQANDGVVELDSCRGLFDVNLFQRDYRNTRFYLGSLNHFDLGFSHGDGPFGADKKPVKWFECLL